MNTTSLTVLIWNVRVLPLPLRQAVAVLVIRGAFVCNDRGKGLLIESFRLVVYDVVFFILFGVVGVQFGHRLMFNLGKVLRLRVVDDLLGEGFDESLILGLLEGDVFL